MNVMAPHSSARQTLTTCPADPGFTAAAASGDRTGEDVMTRRQVARLFGVTSAAVATWARRGRLPEIRNEAGRPRYRRADVEALLRRGGGGRRGDRAAVPGSPRQAVTAPGPEPAVSSAAGSRWGR